MAEQVTELGPITLDEEQRRREQKTIIVFMKWLASLPGNVVGMPRRFVEWMQIGAQMKGAEKEDNKRNAG